MIQSLHINPLKTPQKDNIMNFEPSAKSQDYLKRLKSFMNEHVYPIEAQVIAENHELNGSPDWRTWQMPSAIEPLKAKAKVAGLWNLFLPDAELAQGLTCLEYAPLAEETGKVLFSPEIFNCNAPDTGNMEVLYHFGNEAQKQKWLTPLLNGEIRSVFGMTEPDVASSDATNIETSIVRDGDEYVINGRKWYISGAMNEHCKIMILMGKTDPNNANRHIQQSQILVPMDTKGVTVVRPMTVMGWDDAPEGHAEITFENVRMTSIRWCRSSISNFIKICLSM